MSPALGRKLHFWLMVFWATNLVWFWFLPSSWRIPYLIVISIYAIVVGHWSGWSAERPTEIVTDTESGKN